MDRRLIFLDIDGTLTLPGEITPPDSAVRAIAEAQANGHRVVLCTGRNYAMLRPLLPYHFDGFVSSAGGHIECEGEVLYDAPLTRDISDRTMQCMARHQICATAEALRRTYWIGDQRTLLAGFPPEVQQRLDAQLRRTAEQLGIVPIDQYQGEPLYKFIIMYRTEDQLQALREEFGDVYDFVIQKDMQGIRNGELIHHAFDKGRGVLMVSDYYDIPTSRTIGFGDSMNDYAMMEQVGISVCMANGDERLRAISDRVCPRVEEDGLAREFRALGLID